jgi:uncharacterized protein
LAKRFIDVDKGVANEDEALQGARDIIAEWVNQDAVVRQRLRKLFRSEAVISSRLVKGKDEEAQKYRSWFQWEEEVRRIPSHRLMAILRGEAEGYLKVKIQPSLAKALELLERIYLKAENMSAAQVRLALYDAYKRLLQPSLETEIRAEIKLKADIEAIKVFSENLRQLLLAPPLRGKNVLAIDPGFRTGCKVVCLDQHGNLLHNETIYPHPPENKVKERLH